MEVFNAVHGRDGDVETDHFCAYYRPINVKSGKSIFFPISIKNPPPYCSPQSIRTNSNKNLYLTRFHLSSTHTHTHTLTHTRIEREKKRERRRRRKNNKCSLFSVAETRLRSPVDAAEFPIFFSLAFRGFPRMEPRCQHP